MVNVLYNNRLGSAYVLMSSVRGKLCLYHLNLEGATYTSDLKDGKGGLVGGSRILSGPFGRWHPMHPIPGRCAQSSGPSVQWLC